MRAQMALTSLNMCTGLPKTALLDYAIQILQFIIIQICRRKDAASVYCTTVISPAWSRSFRVLSLFSRSLYFLLLTGRIPAAAYWISFILLDASTRQLCPRMQSWVGNTCIAALLFRSLQEPFRTCKFSYFFLIDASSESTGESVHWLL